MKRIDDFIKDVLNEDFTRATDFVKHLGYEYGQVVSYFNKIAKDYPGWISGHFQENPDDIREMGFKSDGAKWEMEQFLKSGGYKGLEERENRQKKTEIEQLELIAAQRKELMWTRVVAIAALLATIYFGLKKG